MSLSQTHTPPNTEPPYQDAQRPNGVAGPEGEAPGWFNEAMQRITKAIFDVVHFSQHEYLDHRRLPHAIKMSEILIKPHLLQTGEVAVQTVYPVASEMCFVAYYTPLFTNGHVQLRDGDPPEDAVVSDYHIQAWKEGTNSVVHNTPQRLAPWLEDELKRQAHELKLRNMQFVYFTIMKPQHAEAFEDPHGYLKTAAMIGSVGKSAGVTMPTPV